MVGRPFDILHHIGCLKNRAKQSAHHFLRRCIRSSEEGPCLKVTPFKTVMTVLNGVPVLRAAVFCAQSGISADDVRAKRPDGDRKQVGQKIDAQFVGKRSEEHTSELQSLMRISYAVFCLKKKNNDIIYT